MLSTLDFLPQERGTILNEKKDVLQILVLTSKILRILGEALVIFYDRGQYHHFDPHGGDTACQIRAVVVLKWIRSLPEGYQRNHKDLQAQLSDLRKTIDQLLDEFKSNKREINFRERIKYTLEQFFQEFNLTMSFQRGDYHLFLMYFLTMYKSMNGYGDPYIDRAIVSQKLDVAKSMAKKIVHHYQRELARISVEFVLANHAADPQYPEEVTYLPKLCFEDDDHRQVLPNFFLTESLVYDMYRSGVPIFLLAERRTCVELIDNVGMFFLPDPKRLGEYKWMIKPKNSDLKKAAFCMHSITIYNDLIGVEPQKLFSDKIAQVGPVKIILANAAAHPQYSGPRLAEFRDDPFKSFAPLDVVFSQMQQRLTKARKEAEELGCTHTKPTLMFVRHYYANVPMDLSRVTKLGPIELYKNKVWLLENVIAKMPGHIYWKNADLKFEGCNDAQAATIGLASRFELVGKNAFEATNPDLPLKVREKEANLINLIDRRVIEDGCRVTSEEPLHLPDGSERTFLSTKEPLRGVDGNIVGLVGISLDISSQKEAARLREENEKKAIQLKTQEGFMKMAAQVSHDIGTPLASLKMLIKGCSDLPEERRVALREVARSIEDILQHMLTQYTPKQAVEYGALEHKIEFLPALVIEDIVQDRKMKFRGTHVEIKASIPSDLYFVGLSGQVSAFTRMVSNLVNNATDAMLNHDVPQKRIELRLMRTDDTLRIEIEDTGIGMSPELQHKILKGESFTHGKSNGHGIGLAQVRETLQNNRGEMSIRSVIGQGTCMTLDFQYPLRPRWLADRIQMNDDDMCVIIDDDQSIHMAWQVRFEKILPQHPKIQLKHFTVGEEALNYMSGLSIADRSRVLLLSDYELLNQPKTGLDIIKESQIPRSLLVTSHFSNEKIQLEALQAGSKILPKRLAFEISMEVMSHKRKRTVDLVILEDDIVLLDVIRMNYADDLNILFFSSPEAFLASDPQHTLDKSITISMDHHYVKSQYSGLALAKILHEMGFDHLVLTSGESFDPEMIPSYIRFVDKGVMSDFIKELVDKRNVMTDKLKGSTKSSKSLELV